MTWNYGKFAGLQVQSKIWRIELQANLASEQVKKMCPASSTAPQSAQNPVAGPCLGAICWLDGNLSKMSCQAKILIFKGTLASHTSLWKSTDAPCDSLA
jgi:hypothetical protein